MKFGGSALGVTEGSDDLSRCGVFRAKTVSAAVNRKRVKLAAFKGCDNVKIHRVADGAGLFGAFKNGNRFCACGDSAKEVLNRERTVKVNLNKTNLFAVGVKVINRFFARTGNRAHGYDYMFCIGCAVVVEQAVVGAQFGVNLVHVLLNNFGKGFVVFVGGLFNLEENVGVLGGTALFGVFGVERTVTELFNRLFIEHFVKVFIVPNLDFLNFVRGAETVEEVNKRNTAFNGGKVRYRAKVHNLLRVVGAKHRNAGLTAGVNVAVLAENRKGVAGNRTRRYVDNAGEQFARDFIKVGDH